MAASRDTAAPSRPIDGIFRALSDPTRARVVERLNRSPASVSELAALRHGPALLRRASRGSGRLRTGALAKERPGPDLSVCARTASSRKAGSPNSARCGSAASTSSTIISSNSRTRRNERNAAEGRPETRPRSRPGRRRAARVGVDRLDHARAPHEMVRAATLDVADCEIDLRPGGIFRTRDAFAGGRGFRESAATSTSPRSSGWCGPTRCSRAIAPHSSRSPQGRAAFFTAVLTLLPQGQKTRYVATVMHRDEADRKSHEDWASMMAGARCSTSSSNTRRQCKSQEHEK